MPIQNYEQGADWIRIETYLGRWWQWLRTGVSGNYTVVDRLAYALVGALHFINAPYKMEIALITVEILRD